MSIFLEGNGKWADKQINLGHFGLLVFLFAFCDFTTHFILFWVVESETSILNFCSIPTPEPFYFAFAQSRKRKLWDREWLPFYNAEVVGILKRVRCVRSVRTTWRIMGCHVGEWMSTYNGDVLLLSKNTEKRTPDVNVKFSRCIEKEIQNRIDPLRPIPVNKLGDECLPPVKYIDLLTFTYFNSGIFNIIRYVLYYTVEAFRSL